MTQKERERLIMLARVKKKEMNLRQAAGVLCELSAGQAGLVHRWQYGGFPVTQYW